MPAEIEVMEDCASNYGTFRVPGSRGNYYIVYWSGSEGEPVCVVEDTREKCPDIKNRGNCRHIRYVWDNACMYNPQWHEGKSDPPLRPIVTDTTLPDSHCPACGGPTIAVRRAV